MSNIFAYGTLQNKEVMAALIGREVPTEQASLDGFEVFGLSDRYYPAAVPSEGSTAPGLLLRDLSDVELQIITDWEGDEYEPVEVAIDGLSAICFAWKKSRESFVEGWDNDTFRQTVMDHVAGTKIPAFLDSRL